MRTTPLLLLALALPTHARRPSSPPPPKVPSIEEVVAAEGFTPTPSQSDIYKPGTVLVPNALGGHDKVFSGCIDAVPEVAFMSQSSIATSLSAGVSARLSAARGAVAAGIEKRLSFVDPEQRTIDLAKLEATEACAQAVAKAGRFIDLTQAIVLYDVLVAQIQNTVCTKADASGSVVLLGKAEAAAYSECVQESDTQVPLGYKAVPLSKVLTVPGAAVPASTPPPAVTTGAKWVAWGGYGMVAIPAGSFTMGCTPGAGRDGWDGLSAQSGCDDDEKPSHTVQIMQAYLLGETEVTQGLWESVIPGSKPSEHRRCGSDCPVENVSWRSAVFFANALSVRDRLQECYRMSVPPEPDAVSWIGGLSCTGYRLPTESEWEYAARAGEDTLYAGGNSTDSVAWTLSNKGKRNTTRAVGGKQANAWGLYDMTGNVSEWTWDLYGSGYGSYPSGTVTNPTGATTGTRRVTRGGNYSSNPQMARLADRQRLPPDYSHVTLGFRLARSIP
jgi:formylglycine-generating enzyme required for sulfatase activity